MVLILAAALLATPSAAQRTIPPPPPMVEPVVPALSTHHQVHVCDARTITLELVTRALSYVQVTSYHVDGRSAPMADIDAWNQALKQIDSLDWASLRCHPDGELVTVQGFSRTATGTITVGASLSRERPIHLGTRRR